MGRSVDVLEDMKHDMDQEARTGRWARRCDILKNNGNDLTARLSSTSCFLLLSGQKRLLLLRAVNLHGGARWVCLV